MEWDRVLEYEEDIREIAYRWSIRREASFMEDAVQKCMLVLHEEVDVSNASGREREYVRGAIWNIVEKFFRKQEKWDFTSLDNLLDAGFQVDSNSRVLWNSSRYYNKFGDNE